jgi:hypothetical protein
MKQIYAFYEVDFYFAVFAFAKAKQADYKFTEMNVHYTASKVDQQLQLHTNS